MNKYDGQIAGDPEQADTVYVAPEIQTYSPEEFMDVLGPAQGYGGGGGGGTPPGTPGRGSSGRGYRLYPGLR